VADGELAGLAGGAAVTAAGALALNLLQNREAAAAAAKERPLSAAVAGEVFLAAAEHGCADVTLTVRCEVERAQRFESVKNAKLVSQLRTASASSFSAGVLPAATPALADCMLRHLVEMVPALHASHARYEEMDAVVHAAFEGLAHAKEAHAREGVSQGGGKGRALVAMSEGERAMLDGARARGGGLSWSRVPGTVGDSVSYFRHAAAGTSSWGKATASVDASAAHVLSWLLAFGSNERRREHAERNPGMLKMSEAVPGSRSSFQVAGRRLPPGAGDRLFAVWCVWDIEEGGECVMGMAPYEDYGVCEQTAEVRKAVEAGVAAGSFTVGKIHGAFKMTPRAPSACDVTLVFQAQAGG
jgi:hypothetical protein